jgi:inner membrane protein
VQKLLLLRIATVLLLVLFLLIPLNMIHGVVAQRAELQSGVESTVAASYSGPQRMAGPLLVVTYTLSELVVTKDQKGREERRWTRRTDDVVFTAAQSDYVGKVSVEPKHKGLYKALIYHTAGQWRARFEVPKNLGLDVNLHPEKQRLSIDRAYLAFGLTDVRGLRGTPLVTWNGDTRPVENSSEWETLGDGIHAALGALDVSEARTHEMTMQLNVGGTRTLSVAPLGRNTTVEMEAAWPHPNFGGRFLPAQWRYEADGQRFRAKWEVSQLASRNAVMALAKTKQETPLETFDVTFIEPVNIYLQAERAVKYGVLFVVLTFAAFFLFEMMKSARIHPMQYALVGLALALFFLLLVSLSEHMLFVYAYLASAAASVALITYYLAHVLRSWVHGGAFGIALGVLYAVLYGLLLSEDNALMLGALLLFAVLAAIMLLTRKLDWYQLDFKTGSK